MGKLLFIPMLTYGHINVCVTISRKFFEKYGDKHEIYFLVDEEYKSKIEKKCPEIKFILYVNNFKSDKKSDENNQQEENKEPEVPHLIASILKFGKLWEIEDRELFVRKFVINLDTFVDLLINAYPTLTKCVQDLKPDFIIYDQLFTTPVGIDQGIPYCLLLSSAPSYFGHYQLPPPQSDLPSEYTPENVKLWEKFIDNSYKTEQGSISHNKLNTWLKSHNCPNLDDKYFHYVESPYLNIYNYPREIDYVTDQVKLPGKWVRCDNAVLKPYSKPFPIPEKLKDLPGKLIYFSVGSMASVYKRLMEHILNILGQLPHRFIVSVGVYGDQYKLYDNMYAENFVDQIAVLQSVDLMITHGGNNSLTECFHFGVPQIVLPLFSDQINNAVRVVEKGFGCKLNPFKCTLEEFEKAIDFCLKEEIQVKCKQIAKRNQEDNGLDDVCEEIVKYL